MMHLYFNLFSVSWATLFLKSREAHVRIQRADIEYLEAAVAVVDIYHQMSFS